MAIKYLCHIKQRLTGLYIECNLAYKIQFTKLRSRLSQRLDLNHTRIFKVHSEILFSCIT